MLTPPDRPEHDAFEILRVRGEARLAEHDPVAIEEPLEIRVECGPSAQRIKRSISITMRTPGHDFELAAGFLFTEGIVRSPADIERVAYCGPSPEPKPPTNVVRVELRPDVKLDLERLSRHFYTSSSCGVCGKSSIDALRSQSSFALDTSDGLVVAEEVLHLLPERLRAAQGAFDATGGIHASALFNPKGELLELREDVGRHNALDKLIGGGLLAGKLPAKDSVLLVSGRASFELVQKASMAGIPVFAAVGAPSSLAIELARETGMTLIGFLRNRGFNIYSHPERVASGEESHETEN
jgi:FdhD protein